MVQPGAIRAGRAFVELFADDTKLARGLKRAQRRLATFQVSVRQAGISMLKFSALFATPFIAGLKGFSDFERQMGRVSVMLDQPEKHMMAFNSGLRAMSVEFGESTETLSKGLFDILSASVAPAKALGVLRASARAAVAGFVDTGTAADVITTLLNSYGLSAENATDVSDLLFQTVKRGKTTMAELAPAIGLVASIASKSNVSLEEMGAALATMTRNGVSTERAVTALAAIISGFLKPTKDAAKAARSFGFELSSQTLQAEGLAGVYKRIAALSPEAIAKIFPNIRALRGVLPALGDIEGFVADVKLMGERAGATEEAYKKMANTIGFTFDQVIQAAIDVGREIGKAIAAPVREAAEMLIEWSKTVTDLIEKNKGLVLAAAKVVIVIGAIGAGLVALSLAAFLIKAPLAIIATTFGVIAAVLGAILSPIGLVITAVAALGVGILDVTGAGGKALEWLADRFSFLKDDALDAWGAMAKALAKGDITAAAKVLWAGLKLEWARGINALKKEWEIWKRAFLDVGLTAFFGVQEIAITAFAGIKTAWAETVGFMETHFASFTTGLRLGLNAAEKQIKKLILSAVSEGRDPEDVKTISGRIDEQAALRADEITQMVGRTEAEIERDTQAALIAIGAELAGRRAELSAAQQGIIDIEDEGFSARLRELQEAVDARRTEFDAAQRAASAPDIFAQPDPELGGAVGKIPTKTLGDMADGIARAVDRASIKGETAGSFSAAALSRMGFGTTVADRTASATERTADATEKTALKVDDLRAGLEFG